MYEMIANVILEYTGPRRCRKQVKSHLRFLQCIICRRPKTLVRLMQEIVDAATDFQSESSDNTTKLDQQVHRIRRVVNILSLRSRNSCCCRSPSVPIQDITPSHILVYPSTISIFCEASRFAVKNENEVSIRPVPPLKTNSLALVSVNRRIRAEVLAYLDSKLSFDIGTDVETLKALCPVVGPDLRQRIRYMGIQIIESLTQYDLVLPPSLSSYLNTNMPNLRTLFISFVPRDPTRLDYLKLGWSLQTSDRLVGPSNMRMQVVMSMNGK